MKSKRLMKPGGCFRLKSFRLKTLLILPLLAAVFASVSCSEKPLKIIEVTSVINFEKTEFDVSMNDVVALPNSFCFDDPGKMYLLDNQNHRVLKFDIKGNLLRQIGRIGQGVDELFRPTGIFAADNKLYILNKGGKEIKWFSLDGEYLDGFKLGESVRMTKSFAVAGGLIFLNQVEDENKEGKLICIYSKDGKLLEKKGNGYCVASYIGNLAFNSVFFAVLGTEVFGTFNATPAYFKAGPAKGEELFKKLEFQELMAIEQRAIQKGKPKPEFYFNRKAEGVQKVEISIYSNGFAVDRNRDVFVCSNIDRSRKGMIYRMDPKGNLKERIVLTLDKRILRVFKFIPYKGSYYALVERDRILHLVKLSIN